MARDGELLPCVTHVRALVSGECLAGALFWGDLYSIAEEVGFSPPRLVTASPITIGDKELEGVVGEGPAGECWLFLAMGRGAGTPCSAPDPPASPLQGTAASSPPHFGSSRCRGTAGPGWARSSTMVGSWDTSESWCSTPTSPSRYGEVRLGFWGWRADLA